MFNLEQGTPVGALDGCLCFHGVCGGSADKDVICPPALWRPPDCWSQTCSASNSSAVKSTTALPQQKHLLQVRAKLLD